MSAAAKVATSLARRFFHAATNGRSDDVIGTRVEDGADGATEFYFRGPLYRERRLRCKLTVFPDGAVEGPVAITTTQRKHETIGRRIRRNMEQRGDVR